MDLPVKWMLIPETSCRVLRVAIQHVPPLLKDYAGAFWSDWTARMTGGASALPAIVAVFVSSWQQALCIIAAVSFAFYTSFRVWRTERLRADKLADRLAPKFEIDFQPTADGIFKTHVTYIQSGGMVPEIFIRGYIESQTDDRLDRCRARITEISVLKNGQWEMLTDSPLPLWWATKNPDGVEETVSGKEKCYFNIAMVRQGQDWLHPTSEIVSPGITKQLPPNQRYRFRVSVDAQGAVGRHLEVEIDWKTDLNVTAKRIG